MKAITYLLMLVASFSASIAGASPIPGGGTTLAAPPLGLYHSPLGFEMSVGGTSWQHFSGPADNKFINAVFKSPNKTENAALTVRVDKLEKPVPINTYVDRWKREFPKYGLDVLGTKQFLQNGAVGFAIDLVNRENKKELRQVVFVNSQKAVILTCRDDETRFRETLKTCNQIMRTFKWTE